MFERPVHFEQAFSGIVFKGSLLDMPAPHKDDDVHRTLVGLSVRSLRRRLTDEGASYNALANEALIIVAKYLLREKRSTIQEAAFSMGFADVRAFHRAFRRWTGTTPSAYQNAPSDELDPGR